MADQDITSVNLGTMKALLTFLSTMFVVVGRNASSPLKAFMNVSDQVATVGQAVNIMVGTPVTSALLTDGSNIVLNNSVGTGATVTLNRYRYIAFGVTQLAEALSGNAAAVVLIQQTIASLLNDIEADCLSQVTAGATQVCGTYNSPITQATLEQATYLLNENKAPSARWGILRHDANAWGAFTQLPQIVYSYQTGLQSPVNTGNFQGPIRAYGADYVMSQAIAKNTNNIDNVLVAPGGMALAARALPLPPAGAGAIQENVFDAEAGVAMSLTTQWNRETQSVEIVAKCVYGYTIPQPNYLVNIKS